jgi:hypothetical protein
MLLSGLLCPNTQAQGLLNEKGKSVLADVFGTASGPEALIVSWTVVEDAAGTYTYSYIVNNLKGDVLLTDAGQPTSTPEIVDAFMVAFDTTAPGAFVPLSQTGGSCDVNLGPFGLFWSFTPVQPGSASPTLSFESDLPPVPGNASATDSSPPSPWASSPDGQQVPVPDPQTDVPEPAPAALFALGLLFLPSRAALRKRTGPSTRT